MSPRAESSSNSPESVASAELPADLPNGAVNDPLGEIPLIGEETPVSMQFPEKSADPDGGGLRKEKSPESDADGSDDIMTESAAEKEEEEKGRESTKASTFLIPAPYGGGSQMLVAGFGILAKPKFNFGLNIGLGYDDNIDRVPDSDSGTNDEVSRDRRGSAYANLSFNSQLQFASKKRVFSGDVAAGLDYLFDRPSDQIDFTGRLGLAYVERLSSRIQFSASADLAYLSRPEISRPNTPTRNVGDYFSGFSRIDLSYRWTRRFTTVSSISYNTLWSVNGDSNSGEHDEILFGTSARYRLFPKISVVTEGRIGFVHYSDEPQRDNDTLYLLIGAEHAGNRLGASIRAGLSLREADSDASDGINPHIETVASWRFGPRASLNWVTSLVAEQGDGSRSSDPTLRSSFGAVYAFTPRLKANLRLSFVRQVNPGGRGREESIEDWTVDARIGLSYTLTNRWGLSASYQYTELFSSGSDNDYCRNRLECGLGFTF